MDRPKKTIDPILKELVPAEPVPVKRDLTTEDKQSMLLFFLREHMSNRNLIISPSDVRCVDEELGHIIPCYGDFYIIPDPTPLGWPSYVCRNHMDAATDMDVTKIRFTPNTTIQPEFSEIDKKKFEKNCRDGFKQFILESQERVRCMFEKYQTHVQCGGKWDVIPGVRDTHHTYVYVCENHSFAELAKDLAKHQGDKLMEKLRELSGLGTDCTAPLFRVIPSESE